MWALAAATECVAARGDESLDRSVDAALFASLRRIAVTPDAEVVLPDIGAAKGLPLLLARAGLGDLLLCRHLAARLIVLPARDAGVRSAAIDAAGAARAVGCGRRDRQGKRRHQPCQGDPCLKHRCSPSN